MKTKIIVMVAGLLANIAFSTVIFAQGQLDPIRLNSMSVQAGVGSGSHYFGNGLGFGPAIKGSFEKGMFDMGPGVITLGGEFAMSFFSREYGNGGRESWTNFFFAGRGAFHYGWDVEGLDTYAGIPVGIGFSGYSADDQPGSHGHQGVFPYIGLFLGANYFFNKNWGINGELGYNATVCNIGVIYKIH